MLFGVSRFSRQWLTGLVNRAGRGAGGRRARRGRQAGGIPFAAAEMLEDRRLLSATVLLNEIKINPPGTSDNRYEYVELAAAGHELDQSLVRRVQRHRGLGGQSGRRRSGDELVGLFHRLGWVRRHQEFDRRPHHPGRHDADSQ